MGFWSRSMPCRTIQLNTMHNNLKKHRKEKKLVKQLDMAHFLDLKGTAILSRYESGSKKPNLKTCIIYTLVLNMPLSKLVPAIYENLIGNLKHKTEELIETISAEPFSLIQEKRLNYFNDLLNRIGCLQNTHEKTVTRKEEK